MGSKAISIMVYLFKKIAGDKEIWDLITKAVNYQDELIWLSGSTKRDYVIKEISGIVKSRGMLIAAWIINLGVELAVAKLRTQK